MEGGGFHFISRKLYPDFTCGSVVILPMQEIQVRSLGGEGVLEKEMAIHSSILAWEIPWIKEPGGLQSVGSQKSQTRLNDSTTARP